MGSWNHTCAISNLHITSGQDVTVFLLVRKHISHEDTTGTAVYNNVIPLPFYGKYDDYGGVEDCHGFGIPIIMDSLKSRLYKFGKGANQYHEIEVTPENLSIEMLFEADHEGRLGIHDPAHFRQTEYSIAALQEQSREQQLSDSEQFELDRLMSVITKEETFRKVSHVVIHNDIMKAILENWYVDSYVGDNRGTSGFGNAYIRTYFKDIIGDIDKYIASVKSLVPADLEFFSFRRASDLSFNHAEKFMPKSYGYGAPWALVDVSDIVDQYINDSQWDELKQFMTEVLTAVWVDMFMRYTRKSWIVPNGTGSQANYTHGYEVLSQAVSDIIANEKAEYEADMLEGNE